VKRLRGLDWEAIAGVIAAVVALVLHLVHVADEAVLLAVVLVLLALILLRDIRRETREEEDTALLRGVVDAVPQLRSLLSKPDVLLIGPRDLRRASERFARRAQGEMIWYNVCLLMFVPQDLFDALLRPAVENPAVTGIQFVLDRREQGRWQESVQPKLADTPGRDKVREPRWTQLPETISFILAENEGSEKEAHLSFWGEPFMARTPGGDLPRYVLHVQAGSELIGRLEDLAHQSRLAPVARSSPAPRRGDRPTGSSGVP
jgi:hypothetical protein